MTKLEIGAMVAGLGPEVDGVVKYGIEIDNFRDSTDSADCPARIMLPSTEGDVHSGEPTGTGRTSRQVWVVKDLLLYRPAGEGMGWLEVGYSLDAYCDSYLAKLTAANHNTDTGFCTIGSEVLGWDFLVGVHSFPAGSTNRYYGVLVTLRVLEFIT